MESKDLQKLSKISPSLMQAISIILIQWDNILYRKPPKNPNVHKVQYNTLFN